MLLAQYGFKCSECSAKLKGELKGTEWAVGLVVLGFVFIGIASQFLPVWEDKRLLFASVVPVWFLVPFILYLTHES